MNLLIIFKVSQDSFGGGDRGGAAKETEMCILLGWHFTYCKKPWGEGLLQAQNLKQTSMTDTVEQSCVDWQGPQTVFCKAHFQMFRFPMTPRNMQHFAAALCRALGQNSIHSPFAFQLCVLPAQTIHMGPISSAFGLLQTGPVLCCTLPSCFCCPCWKRWLGGRDPSITTCWHFPALLSFIAILLWTLYSLNGSQWFPAIIYRLLVPLLFPTSMPPVNFKLICIKTTQSFPFLLPSK